MKGFTKSFDDVYLARLKEEEARINRRLSSAEKSSMRGKIRRELAGTYPAEVKAIEHFYQVNYARYLQTGKPQPGVEEVVGDELWLQGQQLEAELRGISITRANMGKRKAKKQVAVQKENTAVVPRGRGIRSDPERLGNVHGRYRYLVETHGFVPNDIVVSHLMGITHAKAVQLRTELEASYEMEEFHSEQLPHLVNNFWIAKPKSNTSAALKELVEDLSEADRTALIELLRSVKS